jgi:CubicO group peptidase (beta-lactamase class C family)
MFQLASVTKQFTAAAILMLAEDGKLNLSDPIAKILPDTPPAWKDVTVENLLNHTSGIKSYTSLPSFQMTLRKDYTKKELIDLVRNLPLEFKPGEKFAYNNTGYFLLGMIIEKASGKSYGDFLAERIFKPLGMTSTRVNDLAAIIPNRATGYSRAAWFIGLRNGEYVSPTQPFAAGALISSVNDMIKWDAALNTDRLLKQSVRDRMWTKAKLNNGKSTTYGFGWALGERDGRRVVLHGGGINGFSTSIIRHLDDHLTVVVLTNFEGGAAESLRMLLVKHYLGEPKKK